MAEQAGHPVALQLALADYLRLLERAPDERLQLDDKLAAEGADQTGEVHLPNL